MTGNNWKPVLRLEKNKSGRDFVCGDIHGCFDDMEAELKRIRFNKTFDRLFCVGDLIDRGPRSELAAYYMTRHWFFTVMGNHEAMFLFANLDLPKQKKDKYLLQHIKNGGAWAYKTDPEKADAIINAIDELPLIIQVGDVIIAHAALPAVPNLEEIENNPDKYIDTILWHREAYPPVTIPGINKVYVGHSIVIDPIEDGKYMNIDTGIVKTYYKKHGKLTILEIGGGQ